jgi:hypothetical protein
LCSTNPVLFNDEGKELRDRVWEETIQLLRTEAGIDFMVPSKRRVPKGYERLESNGQLGASGLVRQMMDCSAICIMTTVVERGGFGQRFTSVYRPSKDRLDY